MNELKELTIERSDVSQLKLLYLIFTLVNLNPQNNYYVSYFTR